MEQHSWSNHINCHTYEILVCLGFFLGDVWLAYKNVKNLLFIFHHSTVWKDSNVFISLYEVAWNSRWQPEGERRRDSSSLQPVHHRENTIAIVKAMYRVPCTLSSSSLKKTTKGRPRRFVESCLWVRSSAHFTDVVAYKQTDSLYAATSVQCALLLKDNFQRSIWDDL